MKQFDIVLPHRRVEADVILSNAKNILTLSARHAIYIHEGEMYSPEIENTIYITNHDSSVSVTVNIYDSSRNKLFIQEKAYSVYTQFVDEIENVGLIITQHDADLSLVRYRYVHEMDVGYLYTYDDESLSELDRSLIDIDGVRWSTYDDITLSELDYITTA